MHLCGVTETFGDGAEQYRMATNRPTFCLRCTLPGVGADAFRAACVEAFARWSAVCDVLFSEINDPAAANIIIVDHQFDGPSGILADAMLPTPGIRQQRMRIDRNENWIISDNVPANRIELRAVLCHESGHILGMNHLPSSPPPDLMEAAYRPTVVRPQAAESAMMAKLYGPPKTKPPETPVPPLGDSLGLEVIITAANGKRYRAKGSAKAEA